MEETIKIGGRLHSQATGNVVAGADEILYEPAGGTPKKQDVVNQETEAALADRYTKAETYNKSQVNQMVAPQHGYVTVATYADLANISEHPVGCVYRVSNYDGTNSQVDATKYSEYSWDGTQYIHLATKSQIGEVFDVSEYNATVGTLATYDSLDALLSDADLDTIIPAGVRHGGMRIMFVQSSDNKYIQARLRANSFTTDLIEWQIVDEDFKDYVYDESSDYTMTVGGFINGENGNINNNDAWSYSNFIDINATGIVSFYSFLSGYGGIAFYDANKVFISGVIGYGAEKRTPNIPANAVYVRFSNRNTMLQSSKVKVFATYLRKTYKVFDEKINTSFGILNNKIEQNITDLTENLIDISTLIAGKYVKYDSGGVYSLGDNYATDYIPVKEGDELSFIDVFVNTSDSRGLAWYDTSMNYVGEGIQYTKAQNQKIIVPNGVRYLRATILAQNVTTARIIRIAKAKQVNCTDLLINTFCIGDSLTVGADYTSGSYAGNMKENYPYYLKKISHMNVEYKGRAGWSAKDWWRDYGNTDFSQYDSFVIWLGTNEGLTDTLNEDVIAHSDYADFANTNTGCYCKIISKMIEQTPNARIFLVNCSGTSGDLATTNSVIQQIATLYSNNVVGIIDMLNSGLWDNTNEYLNHIINNIHFSRVGNLYLANYIYRSIDELIYNKLNKFNFLILNYGG